MNVYILSQASQYILIFFKEIKVGMNAIIIQNRKLHFKLSLLDKYNLYLYLSFSMQDTQKE